jgi:hypothetical protein
MDVVISRFPSELDLLIIYYNITNKQRTNKYTLRF